MSLSEEALLRLVGMAYDAALDERKWHLFSVHLRRPLAETKGANLCYLVTIKL
jgi:hypothetical protein